MKKILCGLSAILLLALTSCDGMLSSVDVGVSAGNPYVTTSLTSSYPYYWYPGSIVSNWNYGPGWVNPGPAIAPPPPHWNNWRPNGNWRPVPSRPQWGTAARPSFGQAARPGR